ncbi:MAG: ribonuclease H-like domain-containing protein [Patescibacteria group bacterium]|nr:ribonuclease H-like domain-containing protein [Patescibacteria group bacterium]
MSDPFKIAYVDIETSPNLGWVWGKWQQDVVKFEEEWHLLSFAVKWSGNPKVECYALPDFPRYKRDPDDDRDLAKLLWKVFDEADVVVGHNGDKFDIRRSNTRMLENGLGPPSPYKTIDTLKLTRKYFAFNSNKLGDLCEKLGIGGKVKHEGFELWRKCMMGNMAAWARMKKYNSMDVVLLEKLHILLRGWHEGHPNVNIKEAGLLRCPKCGSDKLTPRGWRYATSRRARLYYCKGCKGWPKAAYTSNPGILLR